jgi:hypothetical protein
VTSANQALTAVNGGADQSRNMVVNLTTTTSAAFNVYIPPAEKFYVIRNASAYDATIFCSTVLGNTTAAGTGVTVLAGTTTMLFSDGTNVSAALTSFSGNLVVSTNSTSPALRVTQVGSGDAILVEDSANPDSTPFVVTSTGDVGIGKTTPTVKLDVVGTINASTGFNGTVGATTPAAGTFTSLSDSGNLTFTGTGNRITGDFSNATIANRVAFQGVSGATTDVGSIPPSAASAASFIAFNSTDSGNAGFAQLRIDGGDARFASSRTGTGTYLPMTFYTGGSERMRVDTSGNVGIGTSSPAGKLDIYDASSSIASVLGDGTARLVTSRASTNTSAPEFQMYKYRGTLASPTIVASGDATGRLQFFGYDGAALRATAEIRSEVDATPGASDMPGRLVFYTTADGAASVSERMRIDSSGNVGIGTNAPAYKLDVAGAISTNNNLTFTGTGNRIIGDFSNATIASRVTFQTSTTNGNTIVRAIPNGTGTVASIQAGNSSDPNNQSAIAINATAAECSINSQINGTGTYLPMTFYTGGSERMRILTDGSISMTTSGSANTTHLFRFNENGGEIILNNNTGTSGTLIDLASGTTRMLHVLSTGNQQIGLGADNTTGVVAFMRAGFAEAMRIDSSGNVGIGTSSPITKLQLSVGDATGNGMTIANTNTANNTTKYSAVDYIGTDTVGTAKISGYVRMFPADANYVGSILTFATRGSDTVAERARIDTSGNLLVGTTTDNVATAGFRVINSASDPYLDMSRTGSASARMIGFYRNSSGSLVGQITTTSTATTYATSSDYRLKHDIQPMSGALAKVAALKPVTYKWNVDDSESQGFIAHELQAVVPECVTGEKDAVDADGNPVYQGIDTSFLVATLTAGLQEAVAMIEELKAKVAALEEK